MNDAIRVFLPGPSYVPEDARRAMTKPMVGHRSAGFRELYYGDWKPPTFRIGHMGEVCESDLDALLVEMDHILQCMAAAAVR